jgi:hypothetical protein
MGIEDETAIMSLRSSARMGTGSVCDQPPPKKGHGRPIWDLVIEELQAQDPERDMPAVQSLILDARERDMLGRQRYGTPLLMHNGRNPLIDAYQETLDLLAYAQQAIQEGIDAKWLYDIARGAALMLGRQIRMSGACDFCGAALKRSGEWYNGLPALVFMAGLGTERAAVFVCANPVPKTDKPTPPSCAWRICARATDGAHNMRAGIGCADCGRPEAVGK